MGDATLTFDLSQSDIDVTFTNIRDIDSGRLHGHITWQNIPVTSGSFATGFISGIPLMAGSTVRTMKRSAVFLNETKLRERSERNANLLVLWQSD